jgi:predicted transcriptional regulator
MEKIVVQDIISLSNVVEKYYSILSVLNELGLTPRDIQLLGFIVAKGALVDKKEFYSLYGTTSATMNNSVSKLKKLGMLVKNNKEIVINPLICPKFDNGIDLHLHLKYE